MKRYYMDGGIPTLAVALSEYMSVDEIKKLAALTGSPAPARKADLVGLILQHLDGDRLRAVWQSLDELQKAAVAEVVHSTGTHFPSNRFVAKYGRQPAWGSMDGYRRDEKATPLRFFFYGNGVMPDDLKDRLQAFVPPPAEATVKSIDELPAVHELSYKRWDGSARKTETVPVPLIVRESERPAQRELLSVIRLVDAGKVAVSDKTRRASSATLDAITAVLEGGDFYVYEPPKDKWSDENAGPIRAFAWPLLIQAGGLGQLSGSRLQLTKSGRKALSEPAAGTIRTLWDKWINTTILDELSRIDCVKGQTGKGKRGLTAVASRRDAIADTLTECPVQRWISFDEFYRYMGALGNNCAVTRAAWSLYIGDPQYGSMGYDGAASILDHRYTLCLLFEYAATLGLIDAAFIPPARARTDYGSMWGTDDLPYFSRYDGLMFFRITAMGAYCLGLTDACTPAAVAVKPVLHVLPNLEIAAIGEGLEQGDRLALDAYAVRVSDLVWQLQPGKLLSAIEHGRSVAEVRDFLQARSGAQLPDTVVHLLEDLAERCTRVHDRGLVRLIECADPALAALIANDTRTRKHCMLAGERHIVVRASSEAAFRRALRDVGYLVASGDAGSSKARRVIAQGEPGPQAAEA